MKLIFVSLYSHKQLHIVTSPNTHVYNLKSIFIFETDDDFDVIGLFMLCYPWLSLTEKQLVLISEKNRSVKEENELYNSKAFG